jgi:hypothetical protein
MQMGGVHSIVLDHDNSSLPYHKPDGNEYSTAVMDSFDNSVMALLASLPPRERCDTLILSFFENDNWRYALPERLIISMYERMCEALRNAADPTCCCRIRANWLTLLFSILAFSPACFSEEESRKYFLHSLNCRRLTEDLFFASFGTPRATTSASYLDEGTAQGCIAAVLLSCYLCDRGQVTEAWKMVGYAVRNAQNAGLHRNPHYNVWKNMSEDDRTIRKTAWWYLSQTDK